MKKLSLKLDDLHVESFDTSPERRKTRGTVRGNGTVDEDTWPVPFGNYNPYDVNPLDLGDGLGGGSQFPCDTIDIVKCPPKLPPPQPTLYRTCIDRTCNAWCCGSGSC